MMQDFESLSRANREQIRDTAVLDGALTEVLTEEEFKAMPEDPTKAMQYLTDLGVYCEWQHLVIGKKTREMHTFRGGKLKLVTDAELFEWEL